MGLTETDIECVVSRIFESLNQKDDSISTTLVIELVSSYVSRDRPEFSSLQESIVYNSNNGNIGQSDLKFALSKWAENLRVVNEITMSEDISEYNIESKSDYTSFSSISSHAYRDRIEELNNDIANKKHIINKLKNQIDVITRQHEESHSIVSKERDRLLEKFINEQNHNSALRNIKNDYEEAVESLQNSKQNVSLLKNDAEKSKKEIDRLVDFIATLNEEKQSLMQQIAHLEREKITLMKRIEGKERYNELLQKENEKLTNELSKQKINIEALVREKKSIEEDLENYIADIELLRCRDKNKSPHLSEDSIVDVYNENSGIVANGISLMRELSLLPDSELSNETDRMTYSVEDRDRSCADMYPNESIEDELHNLQRVAQGMKEHRQLLATLFQVSERRAREATVEAASLRSHLAEWSSAKRWRQKVEAQTRAPKRRALRWTVAACAVFAAVLFYSSPEFIDKSAFEFASSAFRLRFEGQPPF